LSGGLFCFSSLTSLSVFLVGPKCTLAASYAAPCRVTVIEYTDGTGNRTDIRPLQLRFLRYRRPA